MKERSAAKFESGDLEKFIVVVSNTDCRDTFRKVISRLLGEVNFARRSLFESYFVCADGMHVESTYLSVPE